MPARRWTTNEEHDFLEGKYHSYLKHQKARTLQRFRAELEHEWFQLFCERKKLFGEVAVLSEEQEKEYTETLVRRKAQLRSWFRNRSAKTWRQDGRKLPVHKFDIGNGGAMKVTGRRRLKPVGLYSRKFYDIKVRPAVKKAIEEQSLGPKQTLAVIKSLMEKAFVEEDEAIKAEIQAEYEAQMNVHDEADGDGDGEAELSPVAQQQMLEFLPSIVREFLGELARKTGWSFSIFGGGPCAEDDGDIRTFSYHHGKTSIGHNFGDVHSDFKNRVIKPYIEFLNVVYPADVRAIYALQVPTENDDVNDNAELDEVDDAELDEGKDAEVDDDHHTEPDEEDDAEGEVGDDHGDLSQRRSDSLQQPLGGTDLDADNAPMSGDGSIYTSPAISPLTPAVAPINTLSLAHTALGLNNVISSQPLNAMSAPVLSAPTAMQHLSWTLANNNGMLYDTQNVSLDNSAYNMVDFSNFNFDFDNFSHTTILQAPLLLPPIIAPSNAPAEQAIFPVMSAVTNAAVQQAQSSPGTPANPDVFSSAPSVLPPSLPSLPVAGKQLHADSDAPSRPKRQSKKPARPDATPPWQQRALATTQVQQVEGRKHQQVNERENTQTTGKKHQATPQRGGRRKKVRI